MAPRTLPAAQGGHIPYTLCVQAGNDFLPNLPSVEVYDRPSGLDLLMAAYKEQLPSTGHLTKSASINPDRLRRLLQRLAADEEAVYERRQVRSRRGSCPAAALAVPLTRGGVSPAAASVAARFPCGRKLFEARWPALAVRPAVCLQAREAMQARRKAERDAEGAAADCGYGGPDGSGQWVSMGELIPGADIDDALTALPGAPRRIAPSVCLAALGFRLRISFVGPSICVHPTATSSAMSRGHQTELSPLGRSWGRSWWGVK
jgi:Xrn1 helical domain